MNYFKEPIWILLNPNNNQIPTIAYDENDDNKPYIHHYDHDFQTGDTFENCLKEANNSIFAENDIHPIIVCKP